MYMPQPHKGREGLKQVKPPKFLPHSRGGVCPRMGPHLLELLICQHTHAHLSKECLRPKVDVILFYTNFGISGE